MCSMYLSQSECGRACCLGAIYRALCRVWTNWLATGVMHMTTTYNNRSNVECDCFDFGVTVNDSGEKASLKRRVSLD